MNNNIPLWFKAIYVLSIIAAFHFFFPVGVENKVTINDKKMQVNKIVYNAVPHEEVLEIFNGELTGYGPDCKGCGGTVNGGKYGGRRDVTNGKIYYQDEMYGEVRILAADKKYGLGTIIRITAPNVLSSPVIGVVLDRGGAIRGNKIDLLFASEYDTGGIGRQKNAKFEILRYGW